MKTVILHGRQPWWGGFFNADRWNVRAWPELRVQTTATRFRVPDVAVLDAALAREPVATHAPIAVFEILSPEDSYKRLRAKLSEYQQMGVKAIFVLDPDTGVFEQLEGQQLVQREEFRLPERAIEFAFAEVARLVK